MNLNNEKEIAEVLKQLTQDELHDLADKMVGECRCHELKCLLREIDVEYMNKRIELPLKLHAKIVNLIGVK